MKILVNGRVTDPGTGATKPVNWSNQKRVPRLPVNTVTGFRPAPAAWTRKGRKPNTPSL